jgi:hypothetical protein
MLEDSVNPQKPNAAIIVLPQPALDPPRLEVVESCNLPFACIRSHNLQAHNIVT